MTTKELAGKILADLNDAQFEINEARTKIEAQAQKNLTFADLEFNDFYCDLQEAYEELDKIIKRLEPYDE